MKFEYEGSNVCLRGLLPKELLSFEVGKLMLSTLDSSRGLFLQLNGSNSVEMDPKVPG